MMLGLRNCNVRQIIPNTKIAFIRHYAEKIEKVKDPKAVASDILQSNCTQLNREDRKLIEDPGRIAKQIIISYPEEPTTCCMSGCANCVWLDYAEKLSAYYKDGGERALKEINEKVSDANIRAFLLHELRTTAKET